jgi:hypothetical protein
MAKILVEQVDNCLREGIDGLAGLIEFDSDGRLGGPLKLDKPTNELWVAVLQVISSQERAIRLIAEAVPE